jgi:peptide/nickel transport system substrate-binding protein
MAKRFYTGMMALGLIVVTGCGRLPAADAQTEPRNRIVYGLTLEPSGFDPHINASSELGIPLRSVYDTLVYRSPDDKSFVPGLATAWQTAPDGLSYTFTLRQGVTFHDGTPFNAAAVGANLDRITNPDIASQKAVFMLGSYERYEIIDDYTIRLILTEPYSPLLDSLSQVYLGIASPTAFSAVSSERYQFHQVGTGPFEFVEYVPGDRLVIRRSLNYTWLPMFYQPISDASVDEIEFRFYSDAAARVIALESGGAHIMGELLPDDARSLAGDPQYQIIPVTIPGQPLQFMFNTAQPPTDNLLVRQALLFATNRELIAEGVFQGFSPVAWGGLASITPFYNAQVVGAYSYDTGQARALLEQAGYVDADNNGFYDALDGDLTVTLIVPPWGLIPDVAQLMQDQWRQIGVRAELDIAPSRSMIVERVNAGDYHLVAFYSFGNDPSLLNDYFFSEGTLNWSQYRSSDLDNLLIEGARQTDPDGRAAAYRQLQRVILEQALILPIRDYVNLNAARAEIQGLTFDAYGWFPLLHNLTLADGS